MKKFTETDLARITCDWLESQGWETFKEVPCQRGGGRCDIVAVRSGVVWVVETKISFSLALFEQCWDRLRERCHGVVAVSGDWGRRNCILKDWAEYKGIGIVEVGSRPRFVLAPRLRRLDASRLIKSLRPEQRDQDGGKAGSYWTPFKTLVEQLKTELREGPLKDAAGLSCLKDYRNRTDAATRRALTDYLRRGLVPGWGVEEREGRLWIVKREGRRDQRSSNEPS